MEINHSKNLHKSTVPIFMVILLASVASLAVIYQPDEVAKIGKSLTARPFRVEPQANGLSRFSLNLISEQELKSISESGRSAELYLELQAD